MILKNKIADKKFLQLIGSGLPAKVWLPKGKFAKTELGVPQGGIASPLLSNIYLHELDKFLFRFKRILDRGKRRRENPEYHKYSNRRARRIGNVEGIKRLIRIRRHMDSKDPNDPNYRRLLFVRYVDDLIVGIIGPKLLAIRVRYLICKFLKHKLKLCLSMEASKRDISL